ncbi:hypothetical protein N2152v2_010963 [Parachlorella kessleri]
MSGFRDFVTGSDACTPSDGAGPSNAAASLADALLGRRAKTQAQLHELPGVQVPVPSPALQPFAPFTADGAAEAALHGALPAIPGLAGPSSSAAVQADVDVFLRGAAGGPLPQQHQLGALPEFQEFESIYGGLGRAGPPLTGAAAAPAPGRVELGHFLQAFMNSGKAHAPFQPMRLPELGLSTVDKCRIRDRSTIMARHMFADRGDQFADVQVARLLESLNINPQELPATAADASWDRIYSAAGPQAAGPPPMVASDVAAGAAMANTHPAWLNEFEAMRLQNPDAAAAAAVAAGQSGWAAEFAEQHRQLQPGGGWAEEFADGEQGGNWVNEFQSASAVEARQGQRQGGDALEQTRKLMDTLSSNKDPKFQNSKFLQFLSKMSQGEVILEGNQAKEVPRQAAEWANEFQQQQGPSVLGEEFASFQAEQHPAAQRWIDEFGGTEGGADWADQFADGVAGGGWVEEFGAEANGTRSIDVEQWESEYLQELERLNGTAGPRNAGEYVMAENNPFLTDTDSFAKGKDLFKRGVLSEAVLALEAECQRNPSNSEAWRLLGTVQAENDDDQQAIAAMNRAHAADPTNLDVLLSLGVSHTNELEQSEAAQFLREWLQRHPKYGPAAQQHPPPPDASQLLSNTARMFESAALAHPQDADVHTALGVVYNLTRDFDQAVEAFRAALTVSPSDYSLWNKLGATLANSSRSSEAIDAYQKALDLKPNYMRAWTNMGISLANLADYEQSAKYYVRALALNPKAGSVWGYLRTSLACAGRMDLMEVAEKQDLSALTRELSL